MIRPDAAAGMLQRAILLHRQGQLALARKLYEAVLAALPGHPQAQHFLGLVAFQEGAPAQAERLIRTSLDAAPGSASVWGNYARVLRHLGRLPETLAAYDQALALKPADAALHAARGAVLADLGRVEEALASQDRAVAIAPGMPELLSNRALTLRRLGRLTEALKSCDRALAIVADSVEIRYNRGLVLLDLGRPALALNDFDAVLAASPGHGAALRLRAAALERLERLDAALDAFAAALEAHPADAQLLADMGNLQHRLGRYPQAAESFARLLAVAPDFPHARCYAHIARIYGCDWTGYAADVAAIAAETQAGGPGYIPFASLAASDNPAIQLAAARRWAASYRPASGAFAWRARSYGHTRIRLAYLSADFHDHATAMLMAGVLERHDRTRFETIALSFGPNQDSPMRRRLIAAFEHFVDVRGHSDYEAAALMQDLEVDIAVDLKGYTGGARPAILAARPAPVQVNYLGYPATMGAAWIDYIIADPIVIPPEARGAYDEEVVTLPHSYQPNDRCRLIAPQMPTRAAAGLPEHGFVFCCFNNNFKITPQVFGVWMALLRAVPGSVLWLLAGTVAAADHLTIAAAAQGVDPRRLVFARRVATSEHLARHRLADLFVDTLPYTAHTTASDALWAGLPVLTCLGGSFAGRVAASLLKAAGLAELICDSLDAYAARAIYLAHNPAALAALRAKLAANRDTCPLFDTDRFRRHIETAYVTMWERQERGEKPAAITVAPD